MNRDPRIVLTQMSDRGAIGVARVQTRRWVAKFKPQPFKWTCQLNGGMGARVEFRRTGNENAALTLPDVPLEDTVGIVKITDNQIEAAEVLAKLPRQLRAFSEEP